MANKVLRLFVELTFSDHANFDDAGIKEITEKIASSIEKTSEEIGITPEGYESTMLTEIHVGEGYSNIRTTTNIIPSNV